MTHKEAVPVLNRLLASLQNERERVRAMEARNSTCFGVGADRVAEGLTFTLNGIDLLIDGVKRIARDTGVDARTEDFMQATSGPVQQDVRQDAVNGVVQISGHGSVSEAA